MDRTRSAPSSASSRSAAARRTASGVVEGGSFGTVRVAAATAGDVRDWNGARAWSACDRRHQRRARSDGETIENDDYERSTVSAGGGWASTGRTPACAATCDYIDRRARLSRAVRLGSGRHLSAESTPSSRGSNERLARRRSRRRRRPEPRVRGQRASSRTRGSTATSTQRVRRLRVVRRGARSGGVQADMHDRGRRSHASAGGRASAASAPAARSSPRRQRAKCRSSGRSAASSAKARWNSRSHGCSSPRACASNASRATRWRAIRRASRRGRTSPMTTS